MATTQPADVFVAFGISGDLAKVMTFRSLYRLERRGLPSCPIVGVAVDDWTVDGLRQHARKAIEATGEPMDEAVFERFAGRLSYLSGDFADAATFQRLAAAIREAQTPVFYPEIPPFLFGPVVKGLAEAGLTANPRGGGGAAVRPRPGLHARPQRGDPRPHRRVAAVPDRPPPGKMGLGEILYLRFANAGFKPVEPEPPGGRADHHGGELRGRGPRPLLRPRRRAPRRGRQPPDAGGGAGAMEPPSGADTATLKDAMFNIFRSMPDADPSHYVRGQYEGYRDIDGVAEDSTSETYAALHWRSTTGAGRGCRSSSGPARACQPPRPSCAWSSGSPNLSSWW
jgi:glucose-6-phosphate 1-dehydrogenase